MYSIGPFPATKNPYRPGVYFVTPFKDGMGGGFARWNGKEWQNYGGWGCYHKQGRKDNWYWFGITEEQAKNPYYIRKQT